MKVIILEGAHQKGKTPTLHMVYAVLQTINAKVINFAVLKNTDYKDFEAELKYQNKTVAIYSEGDTQRDCYMAIKKYARKNVDTLIMAYASFKNALNVTPHTSIVIQKTIAQTSADKIKANMADCKKIIHRI
jgi:uncharacterized protein YajQ (UPF0234 family)